MESWKDIPGVANYMASDAGNIMRKDTGRVLRPAFSGSGYLFVAPCHNGKSKPVSVHRLIAATFLGVIPAKLDVNHINGVKTDNRACNLEFCTRSENIAHAHKIGGRKHTSLRGNKVKHAVLTEESVRQIRAKLANGERQSDIGIEFGVCRQVIWGIAHNKGWRWVK